MFIPLTLIDSSGKQTELQKNDAIIFVGYTMGTNITVVRDLSILSIGPCNSSTLYLSGSAVITARAVLQNLLLAAGIETRAIDKPALHLLVTNVCCPEK